MYFWMALWLKRSWCAEVRNVSLLVAIGVNDEGFREVLAVAEGSKEDKASWTAFLRHLKEHGLKGMRLFVSDKASLRTYDVVACLKDRRFVELTEASCTRKLPN